MGPSVALPRGFERAPELLAYGGELKATFCLARDGAAVLSASRGDLEDADVYDAYRRDLAECASHAPKALVADRHPEYLSSKLARSRAHDDALPLIEVQHHHAHVAACLADNGWPLGAPRVLGIVLDGLGWGDDGTIWGGEFLLADYRHAERIGLLKPVAMLGGNQASREPWRNLYAHLMAGMGWAEFEINFAELELYRYLEGKPRAILDAMLRNAVNAPLASSCGRLFDAMAAAVGICRDRQVFEAEAACKLEAMVDERTLREEDDSLAYPFTIPNLRGSGLPYLEPLAMWRAVLGDLVLNTPAPVMAARFHKGLARALVAMAIKHRERYDTVALSGGCFHNTVLFAQTVERLERAGFRVLMHRQVPPSDGGLALGQAAIGAAHLLARA
jgi:hydrogenase maturation protein HypF